MMLPPHWRTLTILLGLEVVVVALICAPGLNDALAARLDPTFRSWLPDWVRWGLADAVLLPKMAVVWTLTPLGLGVGIASLIRRGPGAAWDRSTAVVALGYGVLVLASAAVSRAPRLSLESAVTVAAIVALAVVAAAAGDRAMLLTVLRAGAAAAAGVAVYALCQHAGWDLLSWSPPDLVRQRSIGTLGNPNFLAAWLVMLLPVALHGSFAAPRWIGRVAWGAGAGFMLAAVVYSYTRGAWLALAAQLLFLALAARAGRGGPSPSRAGLAALGIAAAGGALFVLLAGRPPVGMSLAERALHTVEPTDASSTARIALWQEALLVARDHPLLGTGPGGFTAAARPYRAGEPPWLKGRRAVPGDPHNELLAILCGSGAPACLLLLFVSARAGWRTWSAVDQAAPFVLAAGVGAAVAHTFVQATVPALLVGWILVAWAMASPAANRCGSLPAGAAGATVATHRMRRVLAVGALTLGVGACTAAATLSARVLGGDLDFNLGMQIGQEALSDAGSRGAAELSAALGHLARSRQRLTGQRRGRACLEEAKLLEAVYSRSTPALRAGPQAPAWRALRGQAMRAYEAALAAIPLDPYAWDDLARFLMRVAVMEQPSAGAPLSSRLVDSAMAASLCSCRLDPYNAVLYAARGELCARAGRSRDAEAAYRRSLDLCPQATGVRVAFARLLERTGQTGAAREQIERVPGDEQASPDETRAAREALRRLPKEASGPVGGSLKGRRP